MEMINGGPFEPAGSYRVSATLHNSAGPVPAIAGGATYATTPVVLHAPSTRSAQNQDVVTWQSGMVLPGAHVDACSHVVLQVHCQKPSLLGGAPSTHGPLTHSSPLPAALVNGFRFKALCVSVSVHAFQYRMHMIVICA